MPNEDDLRQLLRNAEQKITELVAENQGLAQAYSDLMEAQRHETEQLVRMSEQMWKLEEALAATSTTKEELLSMLGKMKSQFRTLKEQADAALKAASANASRLELAARLYEIAAVDAPDELDRQMAAYNAKLATAAKP